MKTIFRNICFTLIVSAFCASPALANQMMVGENPGAMDVQMNEGALFKRAIMACRDNPESQECISAKEAWNAAKTKVHNQLEAKHQLFEKMISACRGNQGSAACAEAKRELMGPRRTELQPSN